MEQGYRDAARFFTGCGNLDPDHGKEAGWHSTGQNRVIADMSQKVRQIKLNLAERGPEADRRLQAYEEAVRTGWIASGWAAAMLVAVGGMVAIWLQVPAYLAMLHEIMSNPY